MANDNFQNKLKNALNNAPERSFENDMWADMQARLHPPKRRGIAYWWWLFLLLPLCGFGAYSWWNFNLNTNTNSTILPAVLEEKTIIPIADLPIEKEAIQKAKEIIKNPIETVISVEQEATNFVANSTSKNEQSCDCPIENNSQITNNQLNTLTNKDNSTSIAIVESNISQLETSKPIERLPLLSTFVEMRDTTPEERYKIPLLNGEINPISPPSHLTPILKKRIGITGGYQIVKNRTPNTYTAPMPWTAFETWQFGLEGSYDLRKPFAIRGALQIQHRYLEHYDFPYEIIEKREVENFELTQTEVRQTWLAPEIGFVYRPSIRQRFHPHLGAGLRGEIMLRDSRNYYYEPVIYPIVGEPFTHTERIKNTSFKLPYATIDAGLEIVLHKSIQQEISLLVQSQRLITFDKQRFDVFNWSFRGGILYAF